jgi:hypothetical protein
MDDVAEVMNDGILLQFIVITGGLCLSSFMVSLVSKLHVTSASII